MMYHGLYCRAPYEEEDCDYEELYDSYESSLENQAVEEYYEEKYGA